MSRFFSKRLSSLTPYTPGEQPRDMQYIKLNTNESPFPPSKKAVEMASVEAKKLELYPDPECRALTEKAASLLGVEFENVLMTNGSDEILDFAFKAFCDEDTPAIFPDITYGFYKVFAEINCVPYKEIPLRDNFEVDLEAFSNCKGTVFLANPNAPTGIYIPLERIEKLVAANPDNVVVIDEAYIDFGGESAVSLVKKYDNLLVTQTFSKSRSMAGARLGFGVADANLIRDLNTVKYSVNPYNINRMTMAAGLGVLKDEEYTETNCKEIMRVREFTENELKKLGFTMTSSLTNFVFAKHPSLSGEEIYQKLKARGILVRHFSSPRLTDYNRITIGSMEQMKALCDTLKDILKDV